MPVPTHTPKYRAGDMLVSRNTFFYIISVTSRIKSGLPTQIYLTRMLERVQVISDIRSVDCAILDRVSQHLGNYPAYNWKKFLLQGDPAIESQVKQAAVPAGTAPVKKQSAAPATAPSTKVVKVRQALNKVPNPIVPTPWMYQFVNPKGTPKAKPGAANECECGSFKVGIVSRGYGHSTWCPMYKEKEG